MQTSPMTSREKRKHAIVQTKNKNLIREFPDTLIRSVAEPYKFGIFTSPPNSPDSPDHGKIQRRTHSDSDSKMV